MKGVYITQEFVFICDIRYCFQYLFPSKKFCQLCLIINVFTDLARHHNWNQRLARVFIAHVGTMIVININSSLPGDRYRLMLASSWSMCTFYFEICIRPVTSNLWYLFVVENCLWKYAWWFFLQANFHFHVHHIHFFSLQVTNGIPATIWRKTDYRFNYFAMWIKIISLGTKTFFLLNNSL